MYILPIFLVFIGFAIVFQTVSLNNKWLKPGPVKIEKSLANSAQEEGNEENTGPFGVVEDTSNTCEEDNTMEEEDDKKNSETTFDFDIASLYHKRVIFFTKSGMLSHYQDTPLLPPEQC